VAVVEQWRCWTVAAVVLGGGRSGGRGGGTI